MWRAILVLVLVTGSLALAQETLPAKGTRKTLPAKGTTKEAAAPAAAAGDLLARLKERPNDLQALQLAVIGEFREIYAQRAKDADGALKRLDELLSALERLEPTEDAAKELVAQLRTTLAAYREQMVLAKVALADLEKQLLEAAPDAATLGRYHQRLMIELQSLIDDQPEEAQKQIDAARKVLAAVKEKSPALAGQIEQIESRSLASVQRFLDAARKQHALIGQPAAPLKVEAWVNGTPLTDDDLKGKVVLLDFWAVWCGPCIATFPHLRQWQEEYGDKGLVMIGLTRYYNFTWDEEANKAVRSTKPVSPADEQAMLAKFAAAHNLKHRLAVQADDSLSDYYGVTGIPHVVVIDQQGIVRMMKVGSGEANAKAIEGLIAELLKKPAATP
jgi:thiol-disulfide isomerase/thioredoxin